MDTDGFSAIQFVAKDMRMGRGIALKLKDKLNIDTEALKKNCEVSDIPNWNDFKRTVKKLPETCGRLNIDKLVMPKIECGLDAFKWPNVMKVLKSVFYDSNIEIYVLCNDKDEEPMYVRRSKDGKKKKGRSQLK
ncbi:ADP-ribose glycohydrolase OARD1-like [Frankliniella occidentalis]|uniref:ADP-ribose glycohydrolase OARD1-like n=1 Tax=Frankliniella occidentalis TaxID=133901 RepID=A0A6J1TBC2_FRAOC|nr:ADP-ribose glycohydrolase OARD1-like [Frankliniella occidentalis]